MSRSTVKVSSVKPASTKAATCHTCTLPKHQSHSELDGVAQSNLSVSVSMFALQPPAAAYDPRKYDTHCPVLSSTEHESLSDLLDGTAKKGEKRHFALPTFDVSPSQSIEFDRRRDQLARSWSLRQDSSQQMKRILIGADEPTASHILANNANLKSHDAVLLNQPDADTLPLSVYATDYIPPAQQHPSYDTLRRSRREKALKEFNERICQTESQKYLARCLECSCDDGNQVATSETAEQMVQSATVSNPVSSHTQRRAKSVSAKTVKSKKPTSQLQTSTATSSASATPLSSARSTRDPGSIKVKVPALPLKRLNRKTM